MGRVKPHSRRSRGQQLRRSRGDDGQMVNGKERDEGTMDGRTEDE